MDLLILSGHTSGLGLAILRQWEAGEGHDQARAARAFLGIARRQLQLKGLWQRELGLDLSRDAPWEAELDRALAAWPQPWKRVILINNAGQVGPVGPLATLNPEAMQASLQINALAPLRLMRWALQSFPHASLRIANISSGAATKAYHGWSLYCSGKAALRMMSEVVALEMQGAGRDVRVLSYAPGVVDTPMQSQLRSLDSQSFPAVERFRSLHAAGQLVDPADSARALLERVLDPGLPLFSEARFAAR